MDGQIGIVRQHSVKLVFKVALTSLLFNTTYLIVTLASEYVDSFAAANFASLISYEALIMILLVVLQAAIGVWLVVEWYRDIYFIERGVLIHRSGILFVREERFYLSGLNHIGYFQSFWGRTFQYGDISMMYLAQKHITIRAVNAPARFVKAFEQVVSQFQDNSNQLELPVDAKV